VTVIRAFVAWLIARVDNLITDLSQIEAALATVGTIAGLIVAGTDMSSPVHVVAGIALTGASVLGVQLPKILSDVNRDLDAVWDNLHEHVESIGNLKDDLAALKATVATLGSPTVVTGTTGNASVSFLSSASADVLAAIEKLRADIEPILKAVTTAAPAPAADESPTTAVGPADSADPVVLP